MGDNTFGERGRDSRRKKFFPNNKVNPKSADIIWNVQCIGELNFNEMYRNTVSGVSSHE